MHIPTPLRRSFAVAFEQQYPAWFRFVRSHTRRFRCCGPPPPSHREGDASSSSLTETAANDGRSRGGGKVHRQTCGKCCG